MEQLMANTQLFWNYFSSGLIVSLTICMVAIIQLLNQRKRRSTVHAVANDRHELNSPTSHSLERRQTQLHFRLMVRQPMSELYRKARKARQKRFICVEEIDVYLRLKGELEGIGSLDKIYFNHLRD